MSFLRLWLLLLATCSFPLLPAAVRATEPAPADIAVRLQETYEQTRTLKADFRQVATTPLSRREKHGAGTLVIKKPGQMRWDYVEPARQVLIADGQTVSMYLAEADQMTIMPAKEYLQSDVTYNFFTGKGDINRDFSVEKAEAGLETPESYVLKLIPKEAHPQVDFLYLWVDKEKYLINRIQVVDHFGSITDITFSHIQTDLNLPAGEFAFTPPAGTEIIRR